jgi:hypothetical protein
VQIPLAMPPLAGEFPDIDDDLAPRDEVDL